VRSASQFPDHGSNEEVLRAIYGDTKVVHMLLAAALKVTSRTRMVRYLSTDGEIGTGSPFPPAQIDGRIVHFA
jgi:hypothetical protein